MAAVLQKIAQAQLGKPHMHQMTPQAARAAYARGAEVLDLPRAPLALVQDTAFTARDGVRIAARLYAPREPHPYQPLPTLLYFHGGGFTVGSIETHDSLCRQLSLLADCAVLSVDYRLAPEARFPTAAHDACDALAALASGDWLAA
jgi:acetyl esterase